MKMDLQPIQGWLRVYFVYLLIAAVLSALAIIHGASQRGLEAWWVLMAVARLGFFAFAAYSLTLFDRPWVRIFHIALNAVSAVLVLASVVGFAPLPLWFVMVPWYLFYFFGPPELMFALSQVVTWINLPLLVGWAVTWAVSARARNIYGGQPGAIAPTGEVDPADEPGQDPADPGPMTWAEEDAALRAGSRGSRGSRGSGGSGGSLGISGSSSDSRKGCLKGCLISLGLALVGLAILALFVRELLEDIFGAW